jgi:hypothetical protein
MDFSLKIFEIKVNFEINFGYQFVTRKYRELFCSTGSRTYQMAPLK